jgi:small subunit ribosomal protein S17
MKKLTGVITSNKMQKTVVVKVERLKKHPKYGKYYRVSKKYKAHAADNEYNIGDKVVIRETRPLSRQKKWLVAELIKRAPAVETEAAAEEVKG